MLLGWLLRLVLLRLVLLLEDWAEVLDSAALGGYVLFDLFVLLEQLAELVLGCLTFIVFPYLSFCPLEARTIGCFDLIKTLLQSFLLVCLILLRVYLFVFVLFSI